MKQKQYRLNEIARLLGVGTNWLYYRVTTGQTPIQKRLAYGTKDVEKLRQWLTTQVVKPNTKGADHVGQGSDGNPASMT